MDDHIDTTWTEVAPPRRRHRGRGRGPRARWPLPVEASSLLALASAGALALWAVVSSRAEGGRPDDTVQMVAAAAAAYVAGLLLNRWSDLLGLAAAAVVLVAFLASTDAFSGRPLAEPLGYANANAALLVQAAAAAALAAASRNQSLRGVGVLGAGSLVAITLVVGSAAGLATGLLVVAAAVAAYGDHAPRRPSLGLMSAALLVPTLATVLLVTRPWLPGLTQLQGALSARRLDLWNDALSILAKHPWTGAGPGRFAVESATASSDSDTQAAHSAGLEVAAELGIVGIGLLVATVLCVGVAIRRTSRYAPGLALVGAAGWLALWTHAAVDYVLDFPAVLVLGCFVAGLASAARPFAYRD